ncbi:MAG: Lrp/AsnC family transcriptional regulator, partial [Proteobacteria bacterium]|nr:Lrp/AsnC family transcriptional regulator [Pseudomonadota bacterium]
MATGLDKIDLKILAELQEDASRSSAEISEVVGVSTSTCGNRIKRLTAEGYIKKTVALLSRDKLDMRTQFFVKVNARQHDPQYIRDFTERMKVMPEVLECHLMSGQFDYLLRVVAQDAEDYERIHRTRLARLPGIQPVQGDDWLRLVGVE